jgi:hypothetical protein
MNWAVLGLVVLYSHQLSRETAPPALLVIATLSMVTDCDVLKFEFALNRILV